MKTRLVTCLLFAAFIAGLGTSANAQERSVRSYAQRIHQRVSQHVPARPKARVTTNVSASRYRGSYNRPRRGYGSRGYTPPTTRIWVPGHYTQVAYQVFVPERLEKIWVAPVYETRYRACGTAYQVLVTAGFWKEICHPARYETRYRKQWVPGRYEVRTAANCRF